MPRADVTWGPAGQEMTETEVLQSLLGEDGLTDSRLSDLVAALARLETAREAQALQQKILYHALHSELGTWDAVAAHLGQRRSTVWNRAHVYLKPGEAPTADTGTG